MTTSVSEFSKLPDPLPLVGRDREMAELGGLLEVDGVERGVVLVRGEGGVGKSRVVAELVALAAERDWSVAHGRAYPVETGTPYAIFSDAWLPILRSMESSTIAVLSRGGETELRYLFPALAVDGEGELDRTATEPEELRTRLLWNFAEFTKRYAARAPVLCVLEDVHWADESSLELLHFLARHTRDQPIRIVCTYNDQERDRNPRLIRTERSLDGLGVADVRKLEPLNRSQVAELITRTFEVPEPVVRDFTGVLYGWTRGNPFFLEEILQSLAAGGRLRREGGTWIGWDSEELRLPETVRDAIVGRLLTFSDEARAMANAAAIVGNRASHRLLESVTGQAATEALSALEELCGHGILEERQDEGEIVYDFRHPLVQQTLYDELGLQRARLMHARVAEAMEGHYGARAEAHADELAFHYARTSGHELREKATRYLLAAGRAALERRADVEAINYLEAALERSDDDDPSSKTRTSIVPLLARAHTHVGHFDKAAQLWSSVLEKLEPADPLYAAVSRSLGMTDVWRGRHDDARKHFERGLAAAEQTRDRRALVRLLVAQAHGLHEVGRGTEALDLLDRALPIAEEEGDAELLARVHRALALLHVWLGPPEAATEHAERAIELAQEVGDPSIEFWARWGLAVLEGMRGDTNRMKLAIEEVNRIADRIRSPVLRLWTADMSVELAHATGRWDEGIAEGEKAIATARGLNQRTLLPRLLVWTSQFYVVRGDLDRAEALVDEAVRISGLDDQTSDVDVHRVVPTYIGRAHYRVALGDFEDAIADAERGLRIAEGTGYILWAMHQLLPILAEACLWADHLDKASEVAARMREHAERIDHRLGRAWADATDSLVRWKRGDAEGAVALMKHAADELDDIPMIWSATRLRRQLAGRLFEIGRLEDGRAELDRVHEVCARIGAGLELEKARSMYRQQGLRPPVLATSDGALGLTPTECRVAILVTLGLTNGQVAELLGSSARTASTHLTNIYQKLDIGGSGARVRLSSMIREVGLLDQETGVSLRTRARKSGLLD